MKWVFIVGRPRCGTSFLAERIHAAGIPMWLEKPISVHYEDPAIIRAYNRLEENMTEDLQKWKLQAEVRGVFPCGAKHPRLLRFPEAMQELFAPEESVFIVCCRHRWEIMESTGRGRPYVWKKWDEDFLFEQRMLSAWEFHRFDYNKDIKTEQDRLSRALGREVDLVTHWNPRK